jgi:hypothetical protein
MMMTFSKAFTAVGAFFGAAVSAGGALAHTSLAPHAHPHGPSMLIGDGNLLVAMVAAAIVGGLALAVGRRTQASRIERKRS